MRSFWALLAVVGVLFAFTTATFNVKLSLSSTAAAKGSIRVAVFDSPAAFARNESWFGEVLVVPKYQEKPSVQLHLPPLEAETYAVAVFHDLNDNGQLDKNFFGIPTEPYGFSREPGSKWQKPSWEDISIPAKSGDQQLSIVLKTWKERD